MDSPAIARFIDELLRAKFGDHLPPADVLTQIKKELTDKLNQYLTLRTIESISLTHPEAVNELSTLIKTDPSPDKVSEFIATHVSNPDVLVAQFFADFRNLYLGSNENNNNDENNENNKKMN